MSLTRWNYVLSIVADAAMAILLLAWSVTHLDRPGALHHLVHSDGAVRHPWLTWLRDVHELHHTRPGRNFGVTSPLWDWVLGTWCPPQRG